MVGETYAEITLKNARDVGNAKHGLIKNTEVRETTLHALVDTGAGTLVINEGLRQQLGLDIEFTDSVALANNQTEECPFTEPVKVYWKDRQTSCEAMIMPGDGEALLGAIPLEGMDLMVDTVDQQLVGKHGDKAVFKAVGARRR